MSHFLMWKHDGNIDIDTSHKCKANMKTDIHAPVMLHVFLLFAIVLGQNVELRDKRGHSFIHLTHTHKRTYSPPTGLSSLLSQASLVLSVLLKKMEAGGRE